LRKLDYISSTIYLRFCAALQEWHTRYMNASPCYSSDKYRWIC